jgi:predicted DNA binding CopG/RHH family protein
MWPLMANSISTDDMKNKTESKSQAHQDGHKTETINVRLFSSDMAILREKAKQEFQPVAYLIRMIVHDNINSL